MAAGSYLELPGVAQLDPKPATALDRIAVLLDEQLIIENGGEIPEVALHGSLYYLTRDPEGPGLVLSPAEVAELAAMVVARYRVIILRDLTPENRKLRLYRGLARASVNWQRLAKFCAGRELSPDRLGQEIAAALIRFLEVEIDEVLGQCRASSCVNCPAETVAGLARDLGLDPAALPRGWQRLCPED